MDSGSFAEMLQLEMADGDLDPVSIAQMFGELFGQINGAVLATGAAESHH